MRGYNAIYFNKTKLKPLMPQNTSQNSGYYYNIVIIMHNKKFILFNIFI